MARSAIVIARDFLKHDPGEFHPERPDRLKVLIDLADELYGENFCLIAPEAAKKEEIAACHSAEYIQWVESTSTTDHCALDGDTVTCQDSFNVGLLAVGGFLRLLDSIAAGESKNGFALVRPPGHHALRNRAMGFCLFNTVAIGARYLKRRYGADRVLIVDWDVHHGNGTQDAFYDDPSVLYISTHQYPYYPGTGAVDEVGADNGAGYTVNIPLPAGCADAEYIRVFRDIVIPIAGRFQSQWVLVSAGFDPHRRDPLGGMRVTEKGFAAMARLLLDLADQQAGGKIAFLLEGGYDLAALRNSVAVVLEEMRRERKTDERSEAGGDSVRPLIRTILQLHEKYV